MYIRLDGDECLLARTTRGTGGLPREVVLARLGADPEINLFFAAQQGRRERPELWEGVTDIHLLQALENFKRRLRQMKPALICVKGGPAKTENDDSSLESDR
jgi:hypothetical protein